MCDVQYGISCFVAMQAVHYSRKSIHKYSKVFINIQKYSSTSDVIYVYTFCVPLFIHMNTFEYF
jgi:hypothetical protein